MGISGFAVFVIECNLRKGVQFVPRYLSMHNHILHRKPPLIVMERLADRFVAEQGDLAVRHG